MKKSRVRSVVMLIACVSALSAYCDLEHHYEDTDGNMHWYRYWSSNGTTKEWIYKVTDGMATILDLDPVEQNLVIPSQLYDSSERVVGIGDRVFKSEGFITVSLPDGFTTIGREAFSGCRRLTSISLPPSLTAIDYFAFSGCSSLTSIIIPPNVTSFGGLVFDGCSSLKTVVMPNNLPLYHSFYEVGAQYTFRNCPSDLKLYRYSGDYQIVAEKDHIYTGCTWAKSVVISSAVMSSIVDNAFSGCTGFTSLTIPDRVTSIGASAFDGCTGLTSLTLGSDIKSIGNNAFRNCSKVKSLLLPASVESIGVGSFYGWKGISSLTIPSKVRTIGSQAFQGCTGITTVRIPSNVTSIGTSAFNGCSKLHTAFAPETLSASINDSVFSGCASDFTLYFYNVGGYGNTSPNPPMAKNNNISITPTTRNFGVEGGGNAIITSGSGTWTAAVSDSWITLNATSGSAGYPVAYTVSVNTNAEQRVGYVYVSGWTHTITQEGVGATISPENNTVEKDRFVGTIDVSAANKIVWHAYPDVDWIHVSPASGTGSGTVQYMVEPLEDVSTRQGTLTVAGNTFTVFQYGRRMKLDSYSTTQNYETHVIPITVNALAITQWSVTPNNSWISVVDAGNGQGGDLVTIAIAENPSYKARTGTVTIGTETFTVTQQGRPTEALSFAVSPANSTASVEGANGIITVTATPDLPWTATSGANWLTIYAATANGAGNGNVVYSASPNPTLSKRTGKITITPEKASGMAAKTHTVTQPAAVAALSSKGYEFEAAGESCSVDVSVANIVQWSVSESIDWITVNGSTSRTGPGTVVIQAAANDTVYPRSGTVTIAGKTFSVSQKARGVELEYDTKLFGTDGGYESISIHPDGNVSWTAVASDATWITIFQGDSGTGDGEIMYIVSPYVGNGAARTGWITVGDKKVYITQRAYDLNIEPNGSLVTGNNGAGEFGVSASINDVWNAIVTEPWITIVNGYDSGTGSGTVRFIYTENNTGKTRTGKIIVAGEVYTLEQRARQMVSVMATAGRGGKVSGGGSYDLGSEVTLTAIPDDGYKFSYWTGDVSTMQNPLKVTADVAKSVSAVFDPLPIAFESVASGTDGVRLSWNNLAWATDYRIYRGVTSVPSSATQLAEIVNTGNCTYLDESGVVGTTYWYWIEAEGAEDSVMSDPMTGMKQKPVVISPITYQNLRGATHTNPSSYQEGTLVSFTNPSGVTGYTFAGWTPSQITSDMTGTQTVRASWTANSYTISYNANGGSGMMDGTSATYDREATVSENGFTWSGHEFKGWATEVGGAVVYAPGQPVTNLIAQSGGVVTLYAVWADLVVPAPVITPPDGTLFTGDSCEISLSCEMEDAVIYYSTKGTPRLTDAYRYNGKFTIADTTTIKAIAVKDGVKSEYITATITKRILTLAEGAGAVGLEFRTAGDAVWTPIADASSANGLAVQSGTIVSEEETWLETDVSGMGTFSFCWKVDCEWDDSGDAMWDRVVVIADGEEYARLDGTTDWETVEIAFLQRGVHTIRWVFIKDDYDEADADYADCAWVSGVTWTPTAVVEPIPELGASATAAEVASALGGSADAKLAANIADAAEYAAYRAWALGLSGVTPQQVKDSAYSWLSYALDTDKLIAAAPKEGDVIIDTFESSATDGAFEFAVKIDGIAVGDNALEATIRKVFDIEGAEKLMSGGMGELGVGFSPDNVEVNAAVPENGNVKFTVTPKMENGEKPDSFFFRVKMK